MQEDLPKITLVCKTNPQTAEIHEFFFNGERFVALITHPEKHYAYVVPYSDEFVIEGQRVDAWSAAMIGRKGKFVTFGHIMQPNAQDQTAGELPVREA